ncbi:MAG: magnesium chelatase subunit D family protein [Candidatus Dormibacteraeota bacterium]|nr:magnesium chelatase subunit D family protein [Candidatus Dormibacteraeota bacterium]
MTERAGVLPFTSLVGQDTMKQALLLNAVNPAIGGVLIRGEKGTAKSTAVRGLAVLLPDVAVVAGCRFHCDPGAPALWCEECTARAHAGETLHSVSRPMRVVELPVNASEDRVVGSIDVESAIKRGERRFEPGLLAAANRNLLYVDEVNLLDDHLVDVLLDAAAMGVNTVEREGVSLSHPARLMLVGTMNPEEGELRPQLLDRFGLCVDVGGLQALEDRVRVMQRDRRAAEDTSPDEDRDQERLRAIIARATELLPLVRVSRSMRQFIALICIEAGAVGHRADIVISRTAQTICAWREAEALEAAGSTDPATAIEDLMVSAADVVTAADLALAHRRRDHPSDGSSAPSPVEAARERMEEMRQNTETPAGESDSNAESEDSEIPQESTTSAEQGEGASHGDQARGTESTASGPPQLYSGELFPVRKISLPRDRRSRKAAGKRSQARSPDRRGRYVGAVQTEHTSDVAFDATVRAAAPHQLRRRDEAVAAGVVDAPVLHLERQDLRQKVRRRRTGTLIVFVVDASASMDAEQRMQATKGAVLSLLRDAYVRRDKVSLVVFSGRSARVILQPTSSVDLAEERLQRLGVGGTTPLTHGLVAGLKVVRTERLRDSSVYPLMVLISDGRGNISLFGEEPLLEAQRLAAQIGAERVRMLVIDSARDHIGAKPLPAVGGPARPARSQLFSGGYGFNACLDLAERSGGEYLGLYDLSQGAILAGVERSLRAR